MGSSRTARLKAWSRRCSGLALHLRGYGASGIATVCSRRTVGGRVHGEGLARSRADTIHDGRCN